MTYIVGTGFSRGIGFEFAKICVQAGFSLVHLGRRPMGLETDFFPWDLEADPSPETLAALLTYLENKPIEGFFYGAGLMPILNLTPENIRSFWQSQQRVMKVNYLSCAVLVEALAPLLARQSRSGSASGMPPFVAHISSLAAYSPYPGLEFYAVTKLAALDYFAWIAKRFESKKLRVLSLHPGTVKTDMTLNIIKHENPDLPLVCLLKDMVTNQTGFITPELAAEKIYHFLMNEKELNQQAHGKLFLADQDKIYQFIS